MSLSSSSITITYKIGDIVRPTEKFEYQYGEQFKCYVEFSEQQKWRIIDVSDNAKCVTLANDKGIIIELPTTFFKHWAKVEKGRKKAVKNDEAE